MTISEAGWNDVLLNCVAMLADDSCSDDIYERVVEQIAHVYAGPSIGVLTCGEETHFLSSSISRVDVEEITAYLTHLAKMNPYREACWRRGVRVGGEMVSEIITTQPPGRAEYVPDVTGLRKWQHGLGVSVSVPRVGQVSVAVMRGEGRPGEFSNDDARRIAMLRPFLRYGLVVRGTFAGAATVRPVRFHRARAVAAVNSMPSRRGVPTCGAVALSGPDRVVPREPEICCNAETIASAYGLTRRESEVALEICQGLSYKDIARKLGVTFHTVHSHVKSILAKSGADSVRSLAAVMTAWRDDAQDDAAER